MAGKEGSPNCPKCLHKDAALGSIPPYAGGPLLGFQVTLRKLIVGDRDYRIAWRVTEGESFQPVLEIAEVWAAGARFNAAVYQERVQRAEVLEGAGNTQAQSLADILRDFGLRYSGIEAHAEPKGVSDLPS